MSPPALPNLKSLPFGGAGAVEDPGMQRLVSSMIQGADVASWLADQDLHHRFLDRYRTWIDQSTLNHIKGLDSFGTAAFSLGTSESFDKFYLRNRSRRFRCFRGEYMYHAASWRNYFPDWCFIHQLDIEPNDAVVVSVPFSDTGDLHQELPALLDVCDRLQVPVLIDMAFFGLCRDIAFDLDRPCVTDVTFSLSKTFPVAHARIGMRLTRQDDDDSLMIHHKTAYVNRIGCGIGLELMRRFTSDYNVDRWYQNQQTFCQELNLEASRTVIFGIDRTGLWDQYNRGGDSNRLSFNRYLALGQLPGLA